MKNKWTIHFGAFLLVGALLTGCGTTDNDNMNNEREDDAPLEQNEQEPNMNNQDEPGGNMQDDDMNLDEQMEEDMNRNNNE